MVTRFAPLLALVSTCAFTPTAFGGAPVPKPTAEDVRREMDAVWAELQSKDELVASRATLKLLARPDDAVAYLKTKLRPLKLSEARLKQLLADLGGEKPDAVAAATEELTYFDLRMVMGKAEAQMVLMEHTAPRRLGAILCDAPPQTFGEQWHWYNPDDSRFRFTNGATFNCDTAVAVADIGKIGSKASWTAAIRAVAVLEHIGTPAARAVLEELATGHPDAAPTKAARRVLDAAKKR